MKRDEREGFFFFFEKCLRTLKPVRWVSLEVFRKKKKKNLSDELCLYFSFESSESYRVFFNYLHDSHSIFRAAGINSEEVFRCTVKTETPSLPPSPLSPLRAHFAVAASLDPLTLSLGPPWLVGSMHFCLHGSLDPMDPFSNRRSFDRLGVYQFTLVFFGNRGLKVSQSASFSEVGPTLHWRVLIDKCAQC